MGHQLRAPRTRGRQGMNPEVPLVPGTATPSPLGTQICPAGGWAAPTERGGEETVHDDVSVAADGRGEVRVEGHVQGIVAKEGLILQDTGAEVESHLKGVRSKGWVRTRMVAGPCRAS